MERLKMAFAANVSKPKTISKTRAGSSRTVELKGPLPKAMNIGDGGAKKYAYMGWAVRPEGCPWQSAGPNRAMEPQGAAGGEANRTVPVSCFSGGIRKIYIHL